MRQLPRRKKDVQSNSINFSNVNCARPNSGNTGANTTKLTGELSNREAAVGPPLRSTLYLTMTPGRRSKFFFTISSSSFSLLWEVP